ncbi:uncharacterized protein J8A68_004740, partial [[Candida] subhashii]
MTDSLFSAEDFSKEVAVSYLPFKTKLVIDSIPVKSSTQTKTHSKIYRNRAFPKRIINNIHPELNTHHKLFENAAGLFKDRECLGWRPYDYHSKTSADHFESLTYGQVNEKKKRIGSGLIRSLLANPYKNNDLVAHKKILNHLRDWSHYGTPITQRQNTDCQIEKANSFILSIFATNRMEWILTDLACSSYSITNTALYDTLGPEAT